MSALKLGNPEQLGDPRGPNLIDQEDMDIKQ